MRMWAFSHYGISKPTAAPHDEEQLLLALTQFRLGTGQSGVFHISFFLLFYLLYSQFSFVFFRIEKYTRQKEAYSIAP